MKGWWKLQAVSLVALVVGVNLDQAEVLSTTGTTQAEQDAKLSVTFSEGDPQNCPDDAKTMLEVLPGIGWDNLQNLHMGQVLELKYSKCRITSDRKFLIPDDVYAVPLKKSDVELHSELISHFSNYTSVTANGINVEAHASIFGLSISGSYSKDARSVKMRIAGDKSVTSRVGLRYLLYTVRSQPDSRLHPTFKSRLLDIASFIQANDTVTATYLAGLLVRDYGTHYVTSVDAGAAIVKEDQLESKYVTTMNNDKKTITWSASASFRSFLGFSARGYSSSETQNVDKYQKACTDTAVRSYGGPLFRANFSLDRWIDDLDNNLIAIDRNGDPLFYLITRGALPELPVDTIKELANLVQKSVEAYYKFNVYRGCTSIDSPNFSYIANVDDGSCNSATNNYTFGGVYQACSGGLCGGQTQVNPKTGTFSCPSGYDSVLLQQLENRNRVRHCKHFWFITYGCWDDWESNSYTIQMYWCAATKPVGADSGYRFGGVYTSRTNNPLTEAQSCPEHYQGMKLGINGEMVVCISDDYELGFRYGLPFAGFFSCKTGNPLSLGHEPGRSKRSADGSLQLGSFVYQAGPQSWPKRCPQGFSQHLWEINNGCEINYCVQANALTLKSLPNIRRPPFKEAPDILPNATRFLVTSMERIMVKEAGEDTWKLSNLTTISQMAEIEAFIKPALIQPGNPVDGGYQASTSGHGDNKTAMTVALSVIGTALAGVLILVLFLGIRSRRQQNSPRIMRLQEQPIIETSTYGSV